MAGNSGGEETDIGGIKSPALGAGQVPGQVSVSVIWVHLNLPVRGSQIWVPLLSVISSRSLSRSGNPPWVWLDKAQCPADRK